MGKLRERIEILYKTYEEPELDKDNKLINKKIKKLLMTDLDDSRDLSKLEDFDASFIED